MLEKVISGCQTGADRAGLIAAKACGLNTGGFVCTRNKTELGYEPEFIPLYNLTELNTFDYPKRTLANVNAADATWIFFRGKLEKGSALTEKYCKQLNKQYIIYNINEEPCDYVELHGWLCSMNVKILNIAGNRESVAPGIQRYVEELLTKVFNDAQKI